MSSFARLVGGEWRVTFASGATASHVWHWGPGQRSMRRMAYGMADSSQAASNPWAGEVLYWHPGLRQVRLLSLHEDIPGVGRGVAEGTIRFDGETSDAVITLDQPRGRRRLGQRQAFEGPDKYREILLEDGGAGLAPLNTLDFVRVKERFAAPLPAAEPPVRALPADWKPFEPLVGGTWKAEGATDGGSRFPIHSTFAWEPSLEVVIARASSLLAAGEAAPLLEAYIYRQVRDAGLRCLVLSQQGGVYEGDVTVVAGGALQLDLKAYEGDRVAVLEVRFDIQDRGRLRTRVWSVEGAVQKLTLDVEHTHLEPKRD
jgi:hypothetical protein